MLSTNLVFIQFTTSRPVPSRYALLGTKMTLTYRHSTLLIACIFSLLTPSKIALVSEFLLTLKAKGIHFSLF